MRYIVKAGKTLVSALSVSLLSLSCYAAGPQPTKPTACPMGQIAKLEQGLWQCKPMDITAAPSSDPTAASPGNKPSCARDKIAKLENGVWQCKALEISAKPDGNNALLLPAVQKVREAAR
ncbi:MAG: hypothetical protein V4858_23840 [Pseudomonadota bacterium]